MSRVPEVTPRKMIAALQRAGFVISGSKGGHHYLEHQDDPTRWTTVSVHPGDLRGMNGARNIETDWTFTRRVFETLVVSTAKRAPPIAGQFVPEMAPPNRVQTRWPADAPATTEGSMRKGDRRAVYSPISLSSFHGSSRRIARL